MENNKSHKNHSFTIKSNVTRNNSNDEVTIEDEELEQEVVDYIKSTVEELKNSLTKNKTRFKSLMDQGITRHKEAFKDSVRNSKDIIEQTNKSVQKKVDEEQSENEE
ncbi:hypothetical protein [Oceanobacillus iheyensis HTE831]|uniref:Uncharacterized protein n=1 Tax=Oceanobacillus iheyensis (strain DSM 14371 / CIP 107618 / JCM 11309 / KCTC 3954 / HTE831) TaxID=221109 RepID=Q8ET72_OCEIH|nr:hypothetical protein [Oceanobacillus iheyensis]BAC12346.1 hypothetical protein [Oceanobacillus iheyensis HTE831]